MDALTDILSTIRLRSALHARIDAVAPWGVNFSASDKVRFALVSSGTCHLMAGDGAAPILLKSGDCFLLMGPEAFSLRDMPGSHARPCAEVVNGATTSLIRIGDGAATSSIVTGWFSFDNASRSLLAGLLPPVTCFPLLNKRLRIAHAVLDLLFLETSNDAPGTDLIIGRLSDILLVEAIRFNLAEAGSNKSGLSRLLVDKRLGLVLRAIHSDVAHPWTIGELANIAGMSRSALAAQFKTKAGHSVIDYLLRWRMRLAEILLRDPGISISRIACEVGYDAESSFGRAFKRATGIAPGAYRRSLSRRAEEVISAEPSKTTGA